MRLRNALLLFLLASRSWAASSYECEITRVIDGDTVVALVHLGLSVQTEQTLRLFGINAPEMRGSESSAGARARDRLRELVETHAPIRLYTVRNRAGREQRGKYGRYLATLYGTRDGAPVNLNELMVGEGHAKRALYRGIVGAEDSSRGGLPAANGTPD